ncbi:hypothetical protein G7074_23375 [Pedobacter sp. HDW13]|uniref:hypothetical protein n=1 Tax=Pedobacter sp. HDW13 TaxID=2714940 RepID=UPI001407994C|nr:hypothetical protein [Pedobacter sp. HDW13]QIL41948.1 hypothetical protein G7074_23375 [Pedobacter sp. HDW13]
MGFYSTEPVNPAKTTVTYLWTGLRTPGIFIVEVQGDAPNYSYGFTLTRDPQFVGGLKINSMGWTGPLASGTSPYISRGSFPGHFQNQIVISGSNGDFLIPVKEVPHDQVDSYIKSQAEEAVGV